MTEFIAALVGVTFGAIGYLTAAFWMQPILRYRELKYQVTSDLLYYANAISAQGMNDVMGKRVWERVERNRRHATDMHACYMTLPGWYRKLLVWRRERTEDASDLLVGLSNEFDEEQAAKRIQKIEEYLRIQTERV